MVLRTFCSYQSIPRTEMTASIKNILQRLPSALHAPFQGGFASWSKRFTVFEIYYFLKVRTFSTNLKLSKTSAPSNRYSVCANNSPWPIVFAAAVKCQRIKREPFGTRRAKTPWSIYIWGQCATGTAASLLAS
jgi:hypothetical protein